MKVACCYTLYVIRYVIPPGCGKLNWQTLLVTFYLHVHLRALAPVKG